MTAQATLDTTNGGLFGAGAAVTLTGTLEGPQGLALDAGGNSITLATAVGDQTPLASLKVTASAITFTDPVTVTGALDTTGSGLTTFDSTVTAGSVATGAVVLDGSLITTTSGQSYGAATLAVPTTLIDTGASVITVGTLAGAFPLTINDAGGAITMAGTATGMPPLAELTTTGATVAFNGALAVTGAVNTLAANLTTFDGAVTAGSVATGAVAIDGGSVTTVAGQSYGAATLGGNTTLVDNSGSAITFASTLDGSHTLTIDDGGGAVTFAGAIGNQAPNASLTATAATVAFDGKVAAASLDTSATGFTTFTNTVTAASVATGAVALDGSLITTSAGQRYGAVTLGGNTVLADTGASAITLAGTVEGEHTLTINDAGGAITLAGAVGTPSQPLSSLSATGATIAFDGSLDVATTVQTTAVGLTTFANTVTAGSVVTGAVMFDGPVITTAAGQSYGAARLAAPTTLTDTGASPIILGGTLSGANALTINDAGGAITLTGTVSGTPPLASLTAMGATTAFDGALAVAGAVNTVAVGITTFDGAMTAGSVTTGAVAFAGGSITTSAGQSYGPAMLDRNITLADTAGGAITFLSTLNGANALTLSDAGGTVAFLGAVGNQVPLASLTATAVGLTTFGNTVTAGSVATGAVAFDGGGVTTTAGQTYGTATLGSDATLADTSASAITFAGTLDGARRLTIIDAGGAVTFADPVGSMAPLASLKATAAAVAFDGTVGVAGGLDLTASGFTTFDNSVTAGSVATGAVAFDGAGITTTAGQSYGAATLGTATALTDNGASAITLNGTLGGGYALTINDAGGTITLAGTVNGTPPLASLTATGAAIAFDGAVEVAGAVKTVAVGLTTFDGTVIAGSVATGAVALDGGDVTTSGGQSYGAAMLGGATILGDTSGSAITFAATLDGGQSLTVNDAGGAVTFTGAVGSHAAVASLNTTAVGLTTFDNAVTAGSVTTGAVALDGGSITTTAGQSYGTATLGAATDLTGAGAITFASTLDGGQNLTVKDASGTVTFTGAVGSHAAVASLNTTAVGLTTFDNAVTAGSVTTGAVALDGGSITTTAGQSYGTATLGAATDLTGAGAITFASTLDGGQNLTVNDAGGAVTFTGAVGSHAAVASLNTTAVGLTTFDNTVTAGSVTTGVVALDGGNVTTTAGQSYGAATLGAATDLTGAGAITFASTLDGGQNLTVNDAGGAVTFTGAVGSHAAVASLNTSAVGLTTFDNAVTAGSVTTGVVALDGGNVTTTAGQSYGAATLGAATDLTGAGAITFASTLDGGQNLTVNDAGGAVTFTGAVGSHGALASLATTAAGLTTFDSTVTAGSVTTGAVALDGGNVTTTAGQSYGTATLGAATDLTGAGAITFASTLDGGQNLTVNDAGGTVTFTGAVGSHGALASLTTTAVGLTTFDNAVTAGSVTTGAVALDGGNVTTTAGQSYGTATLGAATDLTGAGAITFASTLDGGQSLTVNDAGGAVTFTGAVGSHAAVASLNTSAVGLTTFDSNVTAGSVTTGVVALDGGSITTTAGQSYGTATLGAATDLTGAGAITFASTLDGGQSLTVNDVGGAVTFTGAVGSPAALASVTATGAAITFDSTVAVIGALDTTGAGQTTFDNAVTAARVTTGAVALDGSGVATSAGQTYNGLATIGADTVLSDTGASPILFANGVGGVRSLTIADAGGAVTFQTGIGDQVSGSPTNLTVASAALNLDTSVLLTGSLDASAVGLTTLAGSGVTTTGSQSYGAAMLASNVGLTVSGGGAITINGAVDAAEAPAFSLGLASNGGAITLNGPVGSAAVPLTSLSASGGAVTFAAPITVAGAVDTSAAALTTFAGTVTADSVATAAVALDGGAITTTWKQSYGAATLGADATLTNTGVGAIAFAGTVDGAHALTVDNFGSALAPAAIDFAGAVGAKTPLASLTASVASGGTLTLGGSVTTTGAQTYTASTLALGGSFYGTSGGNFLETGATQLTNTADIDTTGQGAVAGGNIAFTGQVSGGFNTLSLAAGSGAITLAGVTAANLQLASAALTLNSGTYTYGSPTTVVPAATLNGELTLNQATQFGPVTLGSATTIGSMSNIVFTAPIAGGTNSLTINGGTARCHSRASPAAPWS